METNARAPTHLSIVVPCFNEEESVHELYNRVTSVCSGLHLPSYDFVLVNDGSSDRTWQILQALAASDPHIVAVNLSRNHGHQLALTAGLSICQGERILILDADLQDPPELLPMMMKRMDTGIDVVYGQRTKREGETAFKKATAAGFYSFLNQIVDIDIPRNTGDFRLISRRALDVLNNMPEHHRFIRGMISWIGMSQEAFPYERAPRFAGETKYPLRKMMRFAVDAITGFSIRPLRIATYVGMCFAAISLALIVFVLIQFLLGHTIQGWTSLAVLVLAIGSVQLFVAGVMGEYLGRLYVEAKQRPLFLIQDIVSCRTRSVDPTKRTEIHHAQR